MPVRPGNESARLTRDTRLDRPRGVSARTLARGILAVLEDPETVRCVVEIG